MAQWWQGLANRGRAKASRSGAGQSNSSTETGDSPLLKTNISSELPRLRRLWQTNNLEAQVQVTTYLAQEKTLT